MDGERRIKTLRSEPVRVDLLWKATSQEPGVQVALGSSRFRLLLKPEVDRLLWGLQFSRVSPATYKYAPVESRIMII